MAIFSWHISVTSRRKGQSLIGKVAYISRQKLVDLYHGVTRDHRDRGGIVHSEILLPPDAPLEYLDRATLWNAVDKAEKRRDARTAREIKIALPRELDHSQQIEIVREYANENFVSCGMCVDFALHDKFDGNPHTHILLTTRKVTPEGFGLKNRSWDARSNATLWRREWADTCNRKFKELGIAERIDHRTLAEQGIDREPTIHLGPNVKELARCGIPTNRYVEYSRIVDRNREREIQKQRDFERTR